MIGGLLTVGALGGSLSCGRIGRGSGGIQALRMLRGTRAPIRGGLLGAGPLVGGLYCGRVGRGSGGIQELSTLSPIGAPLIGGLSGTAALMKMEDRDIIAIGESTQDTKIAGLTPLFAGVNAGAEPLVGIRV